MHRHAVLVLAISMICGVGGTALAETAVVIDRDIALQMVQALSAQLQSAEQQRAVVGAQAPNPGPALGLARQQVRELQRLLEQAPSAATSGLVQAAPGSVGGALGGVVIATPPGGYGGRVIVNVPPANRAPEWDRERAARADQLDRHRRGADPYYADQPPPAAAYQPVDEGTFESLLAAIGSEGFSENKLRVLQDGSASQFFLVGQVERLLPLFAFADDRVKALTAIAPRILDRKNSFRLYKLFTFTDDKERARRILEP